MKTYRVNRIKGKLLLLDFEVYMDEDILRGDEPSIEVMVENPDYYFENDWVYVTPDGKIGHIDDREFKGVVKDMNQARAKALKDPSLYTDFKIAEARWIHALSHPTIVKDEKEFYENR